MKYYPKLGTPIYAEQYDGTPESVERITALLKGHNQGNTVKALQGDTLFIEHSGILEDYVLIGDYVGIEHGVTFHETGDSFIENYLTSPVPIKPLEWGKYVSSPMCHGFVAISAFTKYHVLFSIDKYYYSIGVSKRVSCDSLEYGQQLCQAHHDAQVIQLLNLPE